MKPEVHAALRCPVNWGSHGCGCMRGHEGPHACVGADTGCGMEVERDGTDAGGFKWDLYTASFCGQFVSWWNGEYEGNCERHEDHAGPHFDGMSWFDDDGGEVSDPND